MFLPSGETRAAVRAGRATNFSASRIVAAEGAVPNRGAASASSANNTIAEATESRLGADRTKRSMAVAKQPCAIRRGK